MKKSLFIIAATALVVGCASNDTFKDVVDQEIAIGFGGTYIGNITKANAGEMTGANSEGVSSGTLCTDGNTMEVWGWKYNASASTQYTQVFDNTVVTYNSSVSDAKSTKWEYSPLKYWDRAASYNFYAVAPHGVFTMTNEHLSDATLRKLQATSVPAIQILQDNNGKADEQQTILAYSTPSTGQRASNAIDYLVAGVVPCAAGASNQGNNTTDHDVDFAFSHILSKLVVNVLTSSTFVRTNDSYPYIELTKLYVKVAGQANIYNQKTAGEVNAGASDKDQWSGDPSAEQTLTCFYADGNKANNPVSKLTLTGSNQQVASYFVAPSPTSNSAAQPAVTGTNSTVKVQVEYIIHYAASGATSEETCLSDVLTVSNLTRFDQNTVNYLNVKIEPHAIYFDVQSVAGWSEGTTGSITVD
jgi:hypothetical protein